MNSSAIKDGVVVAGASVVSRKRLHDGFAKLEEVIFRRTRRDGRSVELTREILDAGDGVALLPYDPARNTVILVRQFRGVALLNGGKQALLEVCAGKLEGADPLARAIKETEEETGIVLSGPPRLAFRGYSSPGSFSELMTLYVAPYQPSDRRTEGGGLASEGEDIEVVEMDLPAALAMVASGEIIDLKTIALLYFAEATKLMAQP